MIHKRKIQLIAGSTYSVTLPKDWIRKNNLKEKKELTLFEKSDRTLLLSADSAAEHKLSDITLNCEDYAHNIDQVMLSAYYIGVENIHIKAKDEIPKDIKSKIRSIITNMSGTEITHEEKNSIEIKVFLDKSKVDVMQVLFRVGLILDSSLSVLLDKPSLKEIELNEDEIDRLYHLITRVISLSLIDSNILRSSKIENVSSIPSLFLISKRLENFGDHLNTIAHHFSHLKKDKVIVNEVLVSIRGELSRSLSSLVSKKNKSVFNKIADKKVALIKEKISNINNADFRNPLNDLLRFVVNIQEELVTLTFYNELSAISNLGSS